MLAFQLPNLSLPRIKTNCVSTTGKALELIGKNLVFSVNEKKDSQFWYFLRENQNPGDEYGFIFNLKNNRKALDINRNSCKNKYCKVGTWSVSNQNHQLWKIDGNDLISKWNNAKFVVDKIPGPSVYTGQEQTDGGQILIDVTSAPISNPLAFEGMYNKK